MGSGESLLSFEAFVVFPSDLSEIHEFSLVFENLNLNLGDLQRPFYLISKLGLLSPLDLKEVSLDLCFSYVLNKF